MPGPIHVDALKIKVNSLRIIELKDVLQQLGLSRSGRKEEMIDRIMRLFSDGNSLSVPGNGLQRHPHPEMAARIVDAVFDRFTSSNAPGGSMARRLVRSGGGVGVGGGGGVLHDMIKSRVARADPFWELFDPLVMPPAVPQLVQPVQEVAVPSVSHSCCDALTHISDAVAVPLSGDLAVAVSLFGDLAVAVSLFGDLAVAVSLSGDLAIAVPLSGDLALASLTKEVNRCGTTGPKRFTLNRNQLTLLRAKPQEYQLQSEGLGEEALLHATYIHVVAGGSTS
eukprot:gene10582-10740_t